MTRVVKEGLEELQTGGLSARETFQVPALVRGGPCGSTGHVSCLFGNKQIDLCVKNKKMLDELKYLCPDHKK